MNLAMYMQIVLIEVNPGFNWDSCSQTVIRNTWGIFFNTHKFCPFFRLTESEYQGVAIDNI